MPKRPSGVEEEAARWRFIDEAYSRMKASQAERFLECLRLDDELLDTPLGELIDPKLKEQR